MRVIKKQYKIEQFLTEYRTGKSKILNVGSGYIDLGGNCVNLDIQNKLGVGIAGDGHKLPFKDCSFDICILSAVLQYCRNFFEVKDEVYRVLKPGGYVYVDAPFIQPYCIDTPDLYRFSKDGLLNIFKEDFSIVDCGISIAGGSALAFYCKSITNYIFSDRRARFILREAISFLVWPLSFLKFRNRHEVAGAFYLIAQK